MAKDNKLDEQAVQALLKKIRKLSDEGSTYWQDNWKEAQDDLLFLMGQQWPDEIRTERENLGKPCLVINVLPPFVDQVLGDQRQNKPSIVVSAVDNNSDNLKVSNIAGTKDYSLAQVLSGVIKNIEYLSDADTAYCTAFQSAVESGFGYLRILTEYSDSESFDQELRVKAINNQFSVIIDPYAKEYDKSDMRWCIVSENMNKETFKELYPDASTTAGSSVNDFMDGYYMDDSIKVSEYFEVTEEEIEIALLSDGRVVEVSKIKKAKLDVEIIKTRKARKRKITWRKVSGLNLLEGPIDLDCSTIPIIPVYGKSTTIKDKIRYRSVLRFAKDPQRMLNYWDSLATETVALAPKAPFIGTAEQVEGFEEDWATANTSNLAILKYNPSFQGDPGPRREQPASVPSAELSMGSNSHEKIKATLGMFNASIGAQGNETSGKAIMARQREADVGTYAFIDNLNKSIKRVGKLFVELIPIVYSNEKVMRIRMNDDTEDYVMLNQQVLVQDNETGKKEWITINDLNASKYDVVVSTGPSFTTQRVESAESMMQFVQFAPETAPVILDLVAKNMDWPGSDVLTERLKKMMPQQFMTDKEVAEEQQKTGGQPTPQQQAEQEAMAKQQAMMDAEMQTKMAEYESRAKVAEANLQKALTSLEEEKVKLASTEEKDTQNYKQFERDQFTQDRQAQNEEGEEQLKSKVDAMVKVALAKAMAELNKQ